MDWSALGEPSVLNKALGRYFVTVGGTRLLLAFGFFNFWRDLPLEDGAAVKAFLTNPKRLEAANKERSSLLATMTQLGTLANLGSVPVTVDLF